MIASGGGRLYIRDSTPDGAKPEKGGCPIPNIQPRRKSGADSPAYRLAQNNMAPADILGMDQIQ